MRPQFYAGNASGCGYTDPVPMRKTIHLAAALLFAFCWRAATADVAAIRAGMLPHDPSVADALKDITELEPYTRLWTPDWKYPVAKKEAAARLDRDLTALRAAVRANPENIELLLLTALAGRYAYNVDVSGTFDSSASALFEAARLAPLDLRTAWFHASLLCQTTQTATGAEEFLAIENQRSWQDLPPSFWADYMECAAVAAMPSHVLRAADYVQKLHAPASDEVSFLTGIAQKRFVPFDPKKEYAPKDIWEGARAGDDIVFTSTTCGVRFRAQAEWDIDRMELSNGSCVADFSTGPYAWTGSKKRPSILLMVQQPHRNETLEGYAKRFQKTSSEPFTPAHCPAERCIAFKTVKPGAYGTDGDGHGVMVVFEREQPQFPGLVFESPAQMPQAGGNSGTQFYRPNQVQKRIPGKLYYMVLLDTAASIDELAMKDFDFFLENLIAE